MQHTWRLPVNSSDRSFSFKLVYAVQGWFIVVQEAGLTPLRRVRWVQQPPRLHPPKAREAQDMTTTTALDIGLVVLGVFTGALAARISGSGRGCGGLGSSKDEVTELVELVARKAIRALMEQSEKPGSGPGKARLRSAWRQWFRR